MGNAPDHIDDIPAHPDSTHFLGILENAAGLLWDIGTEFARLYLPRKDTSLDFLLAVSVSAEGAELFFQDDQGRDVPARQAHSAHVQMQRTQLLAPLQEAVDRLATAAQGFRLLHIQSLHSPKAPLLRLTVHRNTDMEGFTSPRFHLTVNANYLPNQRSISPKALVAEEAWRFHLLARCPAMTPDTTLWPWLLSDATVTAPNAAQARVVFAVRSSSRTEALRILTQTNRPPLIWRGDDSVETARLLAPILGITTT